MKLCTYNGFKIKTTLKRTYLCYAFEQILIKTFAECIKNLLDFVLLYSAVWFKGKTFSLRKSYVYDYDKINKSFDAEIDLIILKN